MNTGRSVKNRIDISRQCELPTRYYLRKIINLSDGNVNLVNGAGILWNSVNDTVIPMYRFIHFFYSR